VGVGMETLPTSSSTKTRPRHQAKGGDGAEASILARSSGSWRSSDNDNSSGRKEEEEEEGREEEEEKVEVQAGRSAQPLTA
jgi:hypothetical protein